MDIDYLIDRLESLIQTGKRVPLSNKVMIDEQECYAMIDQMRAVVPEEIKAAKRTLTDRDHILDEAEETARQTMEQAERERDMMIEREGLLVEAERQRDLILNEAAQEAFDLNSQAQAAYDETVNQTHEMRDGANQYALQVLQELDALLDKHLGVVRNGMQNFIQQSQHYQQQIEEYQQHTRPASTHPEGAARTRSVGAKRPARPDEPRTEPFNSAERTTSASPAAKTAAAGRGGSTPQHTVPVGHAANRQPEALRPTSSPANFNQNEHDPADGFDFEPDFQEEPPARSNRPPARRDSPYGPGNRTGRPPF